ncbi:class I SAM-dependent methyltransferase [Endozoicomonas atrinae]|uniref:class I SAM-dependent methyltransferase n=1 Tax=Endozoicomonas atrinae TaxID=1333660 RepID=UPI000825AC32|nr:class I SAM-dependent methyltransferase [Endozoicomonas atrinae]
MLPKASAPLTELFEKYDLPVDWLFYGVIFSGLVVPIISLVFGYLNWTNKKKNLLHNEMTFFEEKLRLEREDIVSRLGKFYYPMRYFLTQSKMLYDTFALEEKRRLKEEGKNFNTLRHLCSGGTFSDADKSILEQILEIGKKQIGVIEEEGWAVNSHALSDLLARYSAHLKSLILAHESKIHGRDNAFREYVFPMELPGAIESKIFELNDRLECLVSTRPESKEVFCGRDMRVSKFYNRIALGYFEDTRYIDMQTHYDGFVGHVKSGGLICDIGCGVGRDTQFFIEKGFRVLSTDVSGEMVFLTNTYPYAYAKKQSVLDMHYPSLFDGLWVSAVLQHVNNEGLEDAISRMILMLKKDGVLYISFRLSISFSERLARTVTLHDPENVIRILKKQNMKIIGKRGRNLSSKDNKNEFFSVLCKK